MKTNVHVLSYLAEFFLEWKMFQKTVVQKIEVHILCSITCFRKCAVYEMWKNIVQRDRLQMTIWRMCVACWVPKATNTLTGCVILIAFPLQQWYYELVSVTLYVHCLSCSVSVSQDLRFPQPWRWGFGSPGTLLCVAGNLTYRDVSKGHSVFILDDWQVLLLGRTNPSRCPFET